MPKHVFGAAATGLPEVNRRVFLRGMGSAGAVAGVAAAPAVAHAIDAGRLPAENLEPADQLQAALAELKAALRRLHPEVTDIDAGYWRQPDGTFRMHVACTRRFIAWTGPGFYLVSLDGHPATFWMEREDERTRAGVVYGHVFLAQMWLEDEGRFVDDVRQMWSPNILARVDGGAAGAAKILERLDGVAVAS
jgi:hypothetical protein